MADQPQQIETPAWMPEPFRSTDDLNLSEDGGFRIFADDITLQFGPKTAHGIATPADNLQVEQSPTFVLD